jgi:hypothetical protein
MRDLSLSGKSDQQSIKSQLKPSSDDAAENGRHPISDPMPSNISYLI